MPTSSKFIVDESLALLQDGVGDVVRKAAIVCWGPQWSRVDELKNDVQRRRGDPVDLGDPADFARICGQHWRRLAGAGPAWMRHPDAARWARQLHWARNESTHQSLKNADLIEPPRRASEAASKILREAGHARANEALALYRRATMTDAVELRQRLMTRARSGGIIGYHDASEALGLDFDDKFQRRFFVDALNDTADENVRKREPLLCALVVDVESGLPTVGFWPRLGLTGKTPLSERRAAHASALANVHRHAWR